MGTSKSNKSKTTFDHQKLILRYARNKPIYKNETNVTKKRM